MIVPQFWAEALRRQPRSPGKSQITVRRFGWSDVSQDDAQACAESRAEEAFQRITSGVKLAPRERKVAYNGANGLPIREEVLSRYGEIVVTRNSYGAHCLNTPNVLFADIDFDESVSGALVLCCGFVLVVLGIGLGVGLHLGKLTPVLVIPALFFASPLAAALTNRFARPGIAERSSRRRIGMFLQKHPDWNFALYRTPAGFRLLALHSTFDPQDLKVAECFRALHVDRVYAAMCRNQHCFRARVSPKPWRIGISEHLRPRPGIWPVKSVHVEKRRAWAANYERAATDFAACQFVENLGSGHTDPNVERVRLLHDRLSKALSGQKIA